MTLFQVHTDSVPTECFECNLIWIFTCIILTNEISTVHLKNLFHKCFILQTFISKMIK